MSREVALVVDPAFGNRLSDLADRMPVWVVDEPTNRAAVDRLRATERSRHRSVTTIGRRPEENLHDFLLRAAYDIEDHHGSVSASQPYTALEVHGASALSCPTELMTELGFTVISDMPWGFVARK